MDGPGHDGGGWACDPAVGLRMPECDEDGRGIRGVKPLAGTPWNDSGRCVSGYDGGAARPSSRRDRATRAVIPTMPGLFDIASSSVVVWSDERVTP